MVTTKSGELQANTAADPQMDRTQREHRQRGRPGLDPAHRLFSLQRRSRRRPVAPPPSVLVGLLVADGVLLAVAPITTALVSRWLGFDRSDRVTIVFCGSKKSLSQGITMAKVIFTSRTVGAAVLPLMLFHQIQLMVCAALAQRWGRRAEPSPSLASAGAKSLLPH